MALGWRIHHAQHVLSNKYQIVSFQKIILSTFTKCGVPYRNRCQIPCHQRGGHQSRRSQEELFRDSVSHLKHESEEIGDI